MQKARGLRDDLDLRLGKPPWSGSAADDEDFARPWCSRAVAARPSSRILARQGARDPDWPMTYL